jgi:hypothetical protein
MRSVVDRNVDMRRMTVQCVGEMAKRQGDKRSRKRRDETNHKGNKSLGMESLNGLSKETGM